MENKCSSPALNHGPWGAAPFSRANPRRVPPAPTERRHYDGIVRLSVRVTPRSSADRIDGFDAGGVLRVRVTAPPADGRANEEVIKLLAKGLLIPPRDVVLVAGATSRNKVFEVPLTREAIADRLAPHL